MKVFVNLLKTTKVNVDVADGGLACLEMVKKKRYDLIFLDHMMPDLDGISTLHRMKEMSDSKCDGVPVVALTANAITGAKEMYLAEGFDAFLSKPINPEKLEQMILLLLPRDLLIFELQEIDELSERPQQSKVSDNQTSGVELEDELPTVEGIDWAYGLLHLKSLEILQDTVIDFYRALDSEANYLEDCFQKISSEDALNKYRIKVHSMKTSAALIGATALSGVAKLLEFAARDGAMDVITCVTPVFLADWRSYKEKLKPCLPKEEKQEITDWNFIIDSLEQLDLAMDDMDLDTMDEVMEKLRQYRFPENIQKYVDELSTAIVNLDSELEMKLSNQIFKEIARLR